MNLSEIVPAFRAQLDGGAHGFQIALANKNTFARASLRERLQDDAVIARLNPAIGEPDVVATINIEAVGTAGIKIVLQLHAFDANFRAQTEMTSPTRRIFDRHIPKPDVAAAEKREGRSKEGVFRSGPGERRFRLPARRKGRDIAIDRAFTADRHILGILRDDEVPSFRFAPAFSQVRRSAFIDRERWIKIDIIRGQQLGARWQLERDIGVEEEAADDVGSRRNHHPSASGARGLLDGFIELPGGDSRLGGKSERESVHFQKNGFKNVEWSDESRITPLH